MIIDFPARFTLTRIPIIVKPNLLKREKNFVHLKKNFTEKLVKCFEMVRFRGRWTLKRVHEALTTQLSRCYTEKED